MLALSPINPSPGPREAEIAESSLPHFSTFAPPHPTAARLARPTTFIFRHSAIAFRSLALLRFLPTNKRQARLPENPPNPHAFYIHYVQFRRSPNKCRVTAEVTEERGQRASIGEIRVECGLAAAGLPEVASVAGPLTNARIWKRAPARIRSRLTHCPRS